jgi:PPIC-type PPIASE domain
MRKRLSGLTVLLVASAAGCGGVHHASISPLGNGVVARVAGSPITLVNVRHWMSVLSAGQEVPEPPRFTRCVSREKRHGVAIDLAGLEKDCEEEFVRLRNRTLSFLITLKWVIDEAHDGHSDAGPDPVLTRGVEADTSFGNSDPNDRRLLSEAEQAVVGIQTYLARQQPKIKTREISDFYKANIDRYVHPEKRAIHIIEQIPSVAAARRLIEKVRRLGEGLRFLYAHPEPEPPVPIHEVRPKPRNFARQAQVWHALFSAQPHTLVGPVPLFKEYSIFEIMRIIPGHRRSIAQASATITSQLERKHELSALDTFTRAWKQRWKAKTVCDASYVVEECSGPASAVAPEEPFTSHVLSEGVMAAYPRY